MFIYLLTYVNVYVTTTMTLKGKTYSNIDKY